MSQPSPLRHTSSPCWRRAARRGPPAQLRAHRHLRDHRLRARVWRAITVNRKVTMGSAIVALLCRWWRSLGR